MSMSDEKLDRIAEDVAATRANILNLKEYIITVSGNVTDIRKDLGAHKENTEAHGRKASDQMQGTIVAWLAVAASLIVGLVDYTRKK